MPTVASRIRDLLESFGVARSYLAPEREPRQRPQRVAVQDREVRGGTELSNIRTGERCRPVGLHGPVHPRDRAREGGSNCLPSRCCHPPSHCISTRCSGEDDIVGLAPAAGELEPNRVCPCLDQMCVERIALASVQLQQREAMQQLDELLEDRPSAVAARDVAGFGSARNAARSPHRSPAPKAGSAATAKQGAKR